MLHSRPADEREGYSVEALVSPEFDFAEFEAEHGGIVSADILDIGTLQLVALRVFDLPGMAVAKVILMAVHDFSGLDGRSQRLDQEFAAGFVAVPAASCENDGCKCVK